MGVPVCTLSRCRSRQAAWLEEALLPNVTVRKGGGGRGERELGLRMYQSDRLRRVSKSARTGRSLPLRSYAWRGEPKVTAGRKPVLGVRNTTGWPARGTRKGEPGLRSLAKANERVTECAIAVRENGTRAAHSLSIEGVSGRRRSCRVTAMGSKRSWRVLPSRVESASAKNARRHRGGFATEASEVRSNDDLRENGKNTPPQRFVRSAKATHAS